jgi:hypothetical protein
MVCEVFGKSHQDLAKLDAKSAYNFLVDLVAAYRRKGVEGSTIKGYVKPIKSWFLHNDIIVARPIKIRGAGKTPTLKDEKTPEPYELHSVWKFCKPRQEVEIALIGFSGVRPEVLGGYHGYDGLRICELPELVIDNQLAKVTFKAIPTRVLVRDELSKNSFSYETVLCEEGCMRLEKYLVLRMKAGEKLGAQSAVVAESLGSGGPLSTKTICQDVREAFRDAGFPWRPYILRRYFDTRMGQALAKPEMGLLGSWVSFWMGHGGDIEAIYRLQKKLPDSMMEQMRAAYQRASEMLQTVNLHREGNVMMRREFRATTMASLGFSDTEIKGFDLDKLSSQEFQEIIRKRLGIGDAKANTSSPKQLIVSVEEAKQYVNEKGWLFKEKIGEGEVVIESPA